MTDGKVSADCGICRSPLAMCVAFVCFVVQRSMRYDHTQQAFYLLLAAVASASLVAAWWIPAPVARFSAASGGGLAAILALSFRHLTVRDEGDDLLICFGPLPIFKRRIRYTDIKRAEQTQSSWLDGWGIHISPSGGWTWNLWGFDCVDLYLTRGRKLRVGTNDPSELTAYVKQRIAPTKS